MFQNPQFQQRTMLDTDKDLYHTVLTSSRHFKKFYIIFLKQNLATNGDSFAFVSNGNEKYKKLLNKVIAPVGKGSFTMATIKMLRLTLIM